MSKITQQEVFVTTDGGQHSSMEAAEGHQFTLDNAEVIEMISESYVNIAVAPGAKVAGLAGRTRAFNKNVAASVIAFILSQGGELPEGFRAIEASEELQVRLDAEEAKVAAAKAAKAEKAGDDSAPAGEDTDAEADGDDLFNESETV